MNRWTGLVAAVVAASGVTACGAKVIVIPIPQPSTVAAGATAPADATSANGHQSGQNGANSQASATPAPKPGAKPGGSSKLTEEGMFYALPRTVARVVVKVDREARQLAPYARFTPIFAPGSEAICGTIVKCREKKNTAKEVEYSLQQGATFSTFGEPDPAHVFLVKFTGGGVLDQTLSMAWTETGLLSTASASVTNRTTDIVMSGLKLATSLATKAASGGADAGPPRVRDNRCARNGAAPNDEWIIPILREALPPNDSGTMSDKEKKDAIAANDDLNPLIRNYCGLPATDRPGRDNEDSRNDFNKTEDEQDLKFARDAYHVRLADLVKQRSDLLTSSAINVFDPLKYLEKLESIIDEQVKDLFAGNKSTKTWEIPFEVRDLDPATTTKLLGIDDKLGVCPETKLFAWDVKPPPDDKFISEKPCPTAVTFTLSYYPERAKQLFDRIRGSVDEATNDRSFRYRLPAQVRAVVSTDKKTFGSGLFSVAQLGHVVSLPATRHAKTISYDLAMIEATGALKTFKLGTTGALDTATIDALSAAGGTVIDARNARRKEAEADQEAADKAADELTILTRQQAILKLKDEICALQKKYGLACTVQP